MESFRLLVDAHINAKKLEKEIRKERRNLIKEYKNKNSSDSDWYITKIKYTGFAEQLKKETAKFDKLLQELESLEINEITSSDGRNSVEIIDNNNALDLESESSESESSINGLFRNSVPMTDDLSVDRTQVIMENQENDNEPEPEPEQEEEEEDKEEEKTEVMPEIPSKKEKVDKILNNNKRNIVKSETEYPSLVNETETESVTSDNSRKMNTDYSKNKSGVRINTVRAGYKYGGKGFRVFTGPRNRNKPIYSMTMLYCYETCNKDKKALKNYLIKFGKFKPEMIESVTFKDGHSYNSDYSLIGVRAPLKIIKKKMKQLNKAKGGSDWDMISIFERSTYISATDYINASNVLYVNNFDLLRKGDHFQFTKLFSTFGELMHDIKMGCDKNGDPYAIVKFRSQDDATRCFDDKQLQFNGKRLQIRFSKF